MINLMLGCANIGMMFWCIKQGFPWWLAGLNLFGGLLNIGVGLFVMLSLGKVVLF